MPVTTVHGIVNRIGCLAVDLNISQHRPANVSNCPDNSTTTLRLCPPDGNDPLFVSQVHELFDEIGRHVHDGASPLRTRLSPRSNAMIAPALVTRPSRTSSGNSDRHRSTRSRSQPSPTSTQPNARASSARARTASDTLDGIA